MLTKYQFTSGVETDTPPASSVPADSPGDVFVLGYKNRFTIANSQSAANVTDLVFLKTVYRTAIIFYSIYRSASGGSTRSQAGTLTLVTDGTNWEISNSYVNCPNTDDAGVDFSITSAGQVQYVSDDNGGAYVAGTSVMDWSILNLFEI